MSSSRDKSSSKKYFARNGDPLPTSPEEIINQKNNINLPYHQLVQTVVYKGQNGIPPTEDETANYQPAIDFLADYDNKFDYSFYDGESDVSGTEYWGNRPLEEDGIGSGALNDPLSDFTQDEIVEILNETVADLHRTVQLSGLGSKAGSTGLITLIIGNKVFTTSLGDSTAYCCDITQETPKVTLLNKLHQGTLYSETYGKLAVTHAFGDDQFPVSKIPETTVHEFTTRSPSNPTREYFIITACDGMTERPVTTQQKIKRAKELMPALLAELKRQNQNSKPPIPAITTSQQLKLERHARDLATAELAEANRIQVEIEIGKIVAAKRGDGARDITQAIAEGAYMGGSQDNISVLGTWLDPGNRQPRYMVVFDGHAGFEVSQKLNETFPATLTAKIQQKRKELKPLAKNIKDIEIAMRSKTPAFADAVFEQIITPALAQLPTTREKELYLRHFYQRYIEEVRTPDTEAIQQRIDAIKAYEAYLHETSFFAKNIADHLDLYKINPNDPLVEAIYEKFATWINNSFADADEYLRANQADNINRMTAKLEKKYQDLSPLFQAKKLIDTLNKNPRKLSKAEQYIIQQLSEIFHDEFVQFPAKSMESIMRELGTQVAEMAKAALVHSNKPGFFSSPPVHKEFTRELIAVGNELMNLVPSAKKIGIPPPGSS